MRWLLVGSAQALTVASAQGADGSNFPFCGMATIEKESKAAKDSLPDESRYNEIERLYREIGVLRNMGPQARDLPAGFIKNCVTRKRDTLGALVRTASPTLRSRFAFHYLLGQYLELERNYKMAYDSYSQAATLDPRDYSAPYRAYLMWLKVQTDRLGVAAAGGDLSATGVKQLDEFLSETNKQLGPLLRNPKTPKAMKIEAYKIRAITLQGLNRDAESMADWRQIVAVDPSNNEALRQLAAFEMQRGRKTEARKYLESLAKVSVGNPLVQTNLLELQIETEDFNDAQRSAEQALKSHPANATYAAFMGHALAGNGNPEEGLKWVNKAYKAEPGNEKVKRAKSFVHRLLGERYLREEMPGKAFSEFETALALAPKDSKLRSKMATVLYEHRLNQGFKPADASRQDLERAVKLLEPVLRSSFIEQRTLETYIGAAAHSPHPGAAASACSRYSEEFGSLTNVNLVIDCANGFKAAGQADKARRMLEDALTDPRFRGTTGKLTSALTALK